MSRVCEASGKKVMFGGMRKHNRGKAGGISGPWAFKSQRKTREWKPNLRTVKVVIGGVSTKVKICMRYYKKLRKEGKIWLKARGVFATFSS